MLLKKLLIGSSALLLVGCAAQNEFVQPEPIVIQEYVKQDCGEEPARDHIDLRTISWQVINGRFTLSAEGYEDLGYNTSEIWKGVEQLIAVIEHYRQCIQEDEDD